MWKRDSSAATADGAPARPAPGPVRTPEDEALLDRLAGLVVQYRATVPAIFVLESMKPLSFVGSQALYFFEPMVRALFTIREYERFAALLERRENLEALLVKIEARDDDARRTEREARGRRRAERDAARAARKESR